MDKGSGITPVNSPGGSPLQWSTGRGLLFLASLSRPTDETTRIWRLSEWRKTICADSINDMIDLDLMDALPIFQIIWHFMLLAYHVCSCAYMSTMSDNFSNISTLSCVEYAALIYTVLHKKTFHSIFVFNFDIVLNTSGVFAVVDLVYFTR